MAVELGVLAHGAYSLAHHREDAEDLLQDTYEKALRGLKGFKGDSEIKTWLYRIMINRFNDIKSTAAHQEYKSQVEYNDLTVSDKSDITRTVMVKADLEDTLTLIQQLNPKEQNVMILRVSGYKEEEIAQQLGMPLGTVKSHSYRGLEKLEQLKIAA
jgi:RNA polymerase sigma-70 factor, ECF subfamily